MVEREWREHGAVAVYVCLYEQSSTTYSVKIDYSTWVAVVVCR